MQQIEGAGGQIGLLDHLRKRRGKNGLRGRGAPDHPAAHSAAERAAKGREPVARTENPRRARLRPRDRGGECVQHVGLGPGAGLDLAGLCKRVGGAQHRLGQTRAGRIIRATQRGAGAGDVGILGRDDLADQLAGRVAHGPRPRAEGHPPASGDEMGEQALGIILDHGAGPSIARRGPPEPLVAPREIGQVRRMSIEVICIGAAHWDVLGRSAGRLTRGDDVPGRVMRRPGGVALNIAVALARQGLRPALLAALGADVDGAALAGALQAAGVETAGLLRSAAHPTGRYLAIEDAQGLVAALADCRALEAAGAALLDPLREGRWGAGWRGMVILDTGLTGAALAAIAREPVFEGCALRLVASSSAKAARLAPFLKHPEVCVYCNLDEAGVLCGQAFAGTAEAARALCARGAARAIVTDGPNPASDADAAQCLSRSPADLRPRSITGAGDAFVAAHVAAEHRGAARGPALEQALAAAGRQIMTLEVE